MGNWRWKYVSGVAALNQERRGERAGGYLIPHGYYYGEFRDVPAQGLKASLWRVVGTIATRLGFAAGYTWFCRGMTHKYFPGLVEMSAEIERTEYPKIGRIDEGVK